MEQGKKGELQDDDGDKLPALIGVYEESEIRIQDFYDNNRINLRVKNQRMRAFNRTGYEKGSELGGKIGLNREIQKQNAPLKLGRN